LSLGPVALATARRNIGQRIDRFIEMLERSPREPDPWEAEHIQQALAALEELDFPRGESAMMWTEWASDRRSSEAVANLRPTFGAVSTGHLRDRFSRILREEAA